MRAQDHDALLAYNALGEVVWRQNEGNVTYDFEYDGLGRLESVTPTLPSGGGFDDRVAKIEWAYASTGHIDTVTQYNSSDSVLDQLELTPNEWGQLKYLDQDHDSAASPGSGRARYRVTTNYDAPTTGGRKVLRRSGLVLPSGTEITYAYTSGSGSHDSLVSRISEIKDDSDLVVARYTYMGADRLVSSENEGDNSAVDILAEIVGKNGANTLDRFNRITNLSWSRKSSADFFDTDYEYDRNSNLTWMVDNVHTGFDVMYTNDGLDRVKITREGTRSSGSIASQTRKQTIGYSHTGVWKTNELILDSIAGYSGDELNETRAHDEDNEINTRDIYSDSSTVYSLTHDGAHNLTDDGDAYEFVYDAFNRLRLVKDQTGRDLAEYRYNGLGWRIQERTDVDEDGGVDDENWHHLVYDEDGRVVAYYYHEDADSLPKEELIRGNAGLGGTGAQFPDPKFRRAHARGRRAIENPDKKNGPAPFWWPGPGWDWANGPRIYKPDPRKQRLLGPPVVVDKDGSNGWNESSDGLDTRLNLHTNPFGDVVAVTNGAGELLESARYSTFGIAFGLPAGDVDSDGTLNSGDYDAIATLVSNSGYDVRADHDLSGAPLDNDDLSAIGLSLGGWPYDDPVELGWGQLSVHCNQFGFGGNLSDATVQAAYWQGSLLSSGDLGVAFNPLLQVTPDDRDRPEFEPGRAAPSPVPAPTPETHPELRPWEEGWDDIRCGKLRQEIYELINGVPGKEGNAGLKERFDPKFLGSEKRQKSRWGRKTKGVEGHLKKIKNMQKELKDKMEEFAKHCPHLGMNTEAEQWANRPIPTEKEAIAAHKRWKEKNLGAKDGRKVRRDRGSSSSGRSTRVRVPVRGVGGGTVSGCGPFAAGGGGPVICFEGSTLIPTATGLVPIDELRPGDKIWAYDAGSASWLQRRVRRVGVGVLTDSFVTIYAGGSQISSTPNHLFLIESADSSARPSPGCVSAPLARGQVWVNASLVRPGDVLVSRELSSVMVDRVEFRYAAGEKVYSLELVGALTHGVSRLGIVVGMCISEAEAAGD